MLSPLSPAVLLLVAPLLVSAAPIAPPYSLLNDVLPSVAQTAEPAALPLTNGGSGLPLDDLSSLLPAGLLSGLKSRVKRSVLDALPLNNAESALPLDSLASILPSDSDSPLPLSDLPDLSSLLGGLKTRVKRGVLDDLPLNNAESALPLDSLGSILPSDGGASPLPLSDLPDLSSLLGGLKARGVLDSLPLSDAESALPLDSLGSILPSEGGASPLPLSDLPDLSSLLGGLKAKRGVLDDLPLDNAESALPLDSLGSILPSSDGASPLPLSDLPDLSSLLGGLKAKKSVLDDLPLSNAESALPLDSLSSILPSDGGASPLPLSDLPDLSSLLGGLKARGKRSVLDDLPLNNAESALPLDSLGSILPSDGGASPLPLSDLPDLSSLLGGLKAKRGVLDDLPLSNAESALPLDSLGSILPCDGGASPLPLSDLSDLSSLLGGLKTRAKRSVLDDLPLNNAESALPLDSLASILPSDGGASPLPLSELPDLSSLLGGLKTRVKRGVLDDLPLSNAESALPLDSLSSILPSDGGASPLPLSDLSGLSSLLGGLKARGKRSVLDDLPLNNAESALPLDSLGSILPSDGGASPLPLSGLPDLSSLLGGLKAKKSVLDDLPLSNAESALPLDSLGSILPSDGGASPLPLSDLPDLSSLLGGLKTRAKRSVLDDLPLNNAESALPLDSLASILPSDGGASPLPLSDLPDLSSLLGGLKAKRSVTVELPVKNAESALGSILPSDSGASPLPLSDLPDLSSLLGGLKARGKRGLLDTLPLNNAESALPLDSLGSILPSDGSSSPLPLSDLPDLSSLIGGLKARAMGAAPAPHPLREAAPLPLAEPAPIVPLSDLDEDDSGLLPPGILGLKERRPAPAAKARPPAAEAQRDGAPRNRAADNLEVLRNAESLSRYRNFKGAEAPVPFVRAPAHPMEAEYEEYEGSAEFMDEADDDDFSFQPPPLLRDYSEHPRMTASEFFNRKGRTPKRTH